MKGLTSTIVLAVVLAALGGYIYFVDLKQPAEATKAKIFDVQGDVIDDLSITSSAGEVTHLKKVNGAWRMVEPADADTDPREPGNIVGSLSALEVNRVLDEHPGDLKEFGLDPAHVKVTFTAAGKTHTLYVGDKTPTNPEAYARKEGESRVVLISAVHQATFDKGTFALRDRSILKFDRQAAEGITITRPGSTLHFVKKGDVEWDITEPFAGRADYGSIDSLLTSLTSSEVQKFLTTDGSDLKPYGLDKPDYAITVVTGGTPRTLAMGKTVEGTRYARDSGRPLLFTVGENLVRDLSKDIADFRRREMFEFRALTASKLTVVRDAATLVLERSKGTDGNVWKAGGKALDTTKTEDALTKFALMRTETFEKAAPAGAKAYATIAGVIEDGRSETARFLVSGDDVFVAREGEPGVGKMPKSTFDDALKTIDDLVK